MKTIFVPLRKQLIDGKISIDQLKDHQDKFEMYKNLILDGGKYDTKELESFLYLCLDYYTYSSQGDVLITDREYDLCMFEFISKTGMTIIYVDKLKNLTKWEFSKHKIPGLVGSIKKIYTKNELKKYLESYRGIDRLIAAAKYDGNSCVIEMENGEILSALTRADGEEGQDITQLVRNANFKDKKYFKGYVFVKCELVVTNDSFDKMNLDEGVRYKNRRSATSAICSSPKNVHLAKYLTVIPLLRYDPVTKKTNYEAPDQIVMKTSTSDIISISEVYHAIEIMLRRMKEENSIRVDGVVLYPISDSLRINNNQSDYLDDAIAFKINTNETMTKARYGYVSVGRLGYAVPMLKVEKCDLNETEVEDVYLGSFDKFINMDLHEGETVIAYHAGDWRGLLTTLIAGTNSLGHMYSSIEIGSNNHVNRVNLRS